jgi:hypothetical protein
MLVALTHARYEYKRTNLLKVLETVHNDEDINDLCNSGLIEVCVNVLKNAKLSYRRWLEVNSSQIIFALQILNWGLSYHPYLIVNIINQHWKTHLLYTQVKLLVRCLKKFLSPEDSQHAQTLCGYLLFYTSGLFQAVR